MKLGLTVPTNYVIMGEMFDRNLRMNVAEFEFPVSPPSFVSLTLRLPQSHSIQPINTTQKAYFNYFTRGKPVTLFTHEDNMDKVREVFRETLLGPRAEDLQLEDDFPEDKHDHFPNFNEEGYALDNARRTYV